MSGAWKKFYNLGARTTDISKFDLLSQGFRKNAIRLYDRVKPGNLDIRLIRTSFANSGNPDETSHWDFYCLLSKFNILFQYLKYESNMVATQINLMSEVT